MTQRLAVIANNAMFYKDITQWLRNRSFGAVFALLLGLSELICLLIASMPIDPGDAGPAAFVSLVCMLGFYLFLLAIQGFASTGREHRDRTFELFELSGMSLEKMVAGKVLSLIGQFCFGFFCIVPFLFFSYLLGGVDFYNVVVTVIIFALIVLPVFLATISVALLSRFKHTGVISRIVMVLFMLWAVQAVFGIFVSRVVLGGGSGPGGLIKNLGDPQVCLGVGAFLVCYVQACLFLFYAACNSISPPSDTRETPLKLLLTTLTLSWTGYCGYASWSTSNEAVCYMLAIPVAIAAGFTGLLGFYHRLDPPVMAVRRAEKASHLLRIIYWWFAPGATGTLRTLILMLSAPCLMVAWGYMDYWSVGDMDTLMRALSILLSIPFFLAFPMGFLMNLKKLRNKHKSQRVAVVSWWIGSGLFSTITYMFLSNGMSYPRTSNLAFAWAMELISLVISPISTGVVGSVQSSEFYGFAHWIRMTLGGVGLILMIRMLSRRRKKEAAALEVELGAIEPAIVTESI